MAFDIEMIKQVYAQLPSKIAAARKVLNRPLTLTEKILYSHLHTDQKLEDFPRGKAYVDFAIRHPAHFQVMFRADAVPLDRYPEARKQEDEAFGKLVKEIGKTFASQPPEERRRIAVAANGPRACDPHSGREPCP